jgi:hypothetical protein
MNSSPPRSSRPSRFPLAFAAALPFLGCSGATEHPSSNVPYVPPQAVPPVVNSVATGSCDEGVERKCSVILGTFDGVTSCFVGVQVCTDNLWGPCEDPETGAVAPNAGGAGGAGAGGAGGSAGGSGGIAGGG